jgi:hypothetical protein
MASCPVRWIDIIDAGTYALLLASNQSNIGVYVFIVFFKAEVILWNPCFIEKLVIAKSDEKE